jgi:hypothetical protein
LPDILDHHSSQTIKAFIVGKQGHGKTGAKASLVALGYKLRMLDFDNGADILKNLLTNDYYPYKKYMEDHKIPLRGAVSIIPITEQMIRKVEDGRSRYVPKSANGFTKVIDMLEDWRDGDLKLGPVESWENDCILDFDTFGTLADLAYFHIQALNGRLGARQEGFDYQRDVGGAQAILKNLIQKTFSPFIKCHVLYNSHITWVDESQGSAQRPRFDKDGDLLSDPIGYPSSIGRALSPVVGKYFNNVLIIKQSGSGLTSKHEIITVPLENVAAKSSLPGLLKVRYPIETGLAEILCALSDKPPPTELIKVFQNLKPKVASIPKT